MITRFMRDTPLAAIEIEMQLVPGFTPRACGTFRSQQRYVNPNPIRYEELLGLFLKEIELQAFALRVQRIIEATSNLGESEVKQMLFRNAEHKKRFQSICKSGLFPKMKESYGYSTAQVKDYEYNTNKMKQAFLDKELQSEFDDNLFLTTIKHITVYKGGRLKFEFINGLTLEGIY